MKCTLESKPNDPDSNTSLVIQTFVLASAVS